MRSAAAYLSQTFSKVNQLKMRCEPMVDISTGTRCMKLPTAEVLLDRSAQGDGEEFFINLSRAPDCTDWDMKLLGNSLANKKPDGDRLSFNVFASGVFEPQFEQVLIDNRGAVGGQVFEMLEHGGVPKNVNIAHLGYLSQKYNIFFALDDIKPHEADCQNRLAVMGSHVHMIKLHFSVMETLRKKPCEDNKYQIGSMVKSVMEIRQTFPNAVLVVEGVRMNEWDASENPSPIKGLLEEIGVDGIQIYTPPSRQETISIEPPANGLLARPA
ncbi:MAG: hypothetical protein AAB276_07555 [Pseudomonadota bacterium]|mgnify:CR=1 FL=1